jgi:hypothetical protein
MVELLLTALSLFGVGHSAAASTPADTAKKTTTQSPATQPTQAPVQPACIDGKNYPPTC